MAKETPEYDEYAEKLTTLKQHFWLDEGIFKMVDDPVMLAAKVNKQDCLLHEMVGDMQGRISKFREDMLAVEP